MDPTLRCVVFADYVAKRQATVDQVASHFGVSRSVVLSEVNETVHGLIRGEVRADLYLKENARPLLKAAMVWVNRRVDPKGTRNRINALLEVLEGLDEGALLVIDEERLPPVPARRTKVRKEYRALEPSELA